MNEMMINPPLTGSFVEALVEVWADAVRATHSFLTEKDIVGLEPFVRQGVRQVTLFVMMDEGQPVAFMGVAGDKVEMLFVAPDHFGQGLGRRLITYAIETLGARYVDVNEQNPGALAFYQKMGFQVFERTATDEQGNPFPILKMKLEQ